MAFYILSTRFISFYRDSILSRPFKSFGLFIWYPICQTTMGLAVASSATGENPILRGHILGQEKALEVGFPGDPLDR